VIKNPRGWCIPTAEIRSIIMHFAFTRRYSVFDLHAYGCTVEIWSGFQILFCALSDRSISIIGKFRDWAFYFFYHFGNIIKWCIYINKYICYYHRPRAIVTRNNNIRPFGSQATACDFLFTHIHIHIFMTPAEVWCLIPL